jgi:hypothetical protein
MWEWLVKYWLEVLFGLVTAGVGIALRRISKALQKEKLRNQAIEDGVRDILRMQILDTYERCTQAGKISVSRKDAIDSAYKSYHALGGNGTITQVHNEIMEMPIV